MPFSRRHHPLLLVLLAALLATRALVPAGWMPAQSSHGVRITLCTGQGLISVEFDRTYADHLAGLNRVAQSDSAIGERIPATGRSLFLRLGAAF